MLRRRSTVKPPVREGWQLSVEGIVDNLAFSQKQVWAYFAIPAACCDLLTQGQRQGFQADVMAALALYEDTDYHLRGVPRRFDPAKWRDYQLRGPQPPPDQSRYGWEDYINEQASYLSSQRYYQYALYLGICLGTRWQRSIQAGWQNFSRQVGLEGLVVSDHEVAKWRAKADQIAATFQRSALQASPATTGELTWLIKRSFDPELAAMQTTDSRVEGDELLAIPQYAVDNPTFGKSLVISPGGQEVHVSILSLTRAPPDDIPDGWLRPLHPYVDISVRFRLLSQHVAAKLLQGRIDAANDTLSNANETGAHVPDQLLVQAGRTQQLSSAINDGQGQLLQCAPRLIVTAATDKQLRTRVAQLQAFYMQRFGQKWEQYLRQLPLFLESLPGEHQRVPFGTRTQDAAALGASEFFASSSVGDRTGPYIGHTIPSHGGAAADDPIASPVFWDPLALAAERDSTLVAFLGRPGGGKTNAAWLQLYQAVLRGASALYVTCKEETGGLAGLVGLQGRRNRISLSDTDNPIRLDPYKIASDPDEASDLAFEVSLLLLPEHPDMNQHAALQSACHQEAQQDTKASMFGMIERLRANSSQAVRNMGELLLAAKRHRLGKLAFSTQSEPMLLPEGMLTVVEATNLEPPAAGTPLNEQTRNERISVALVHLLGYWAKRVASLSPHQPKVIAFDEAHILTHAAIGRQLISRLSRMGRTHNTVLFLISQNAGDLLDQSVTNNMAAAFAFRSTAFDEVTAVLQLLDLADTVENRAVIRSFPKGAGCGVMLDPDRRPVPIKIDLVLAGLEEAFNTDPRPELANTVPVSVV
ncbi:ATP-binding protein [Candidatus Parcubacteria bacterium]|nr:ATP-binding protein [Candidatus Parcubacteria bacterium]